jgi:hypothetical protein
LLYEIAQWRIRKENSKKHLECWREILESQKSHRKKFYYTKTRILQLAEEESSEEETWGWIDEYEDREAYDKMVKAVDGDPETAKLKNEYHSKWDPLRVPGSFKAQIWTERLRLD